MNRVVGEPVLLARFSLGALALYIGLCGVLHWQAVNVVQEAAVKKGLEVEKASAYPSPFLPIFWNGVLDDGQFLYQGPVQVPVGAEPTLPGQRLKNLKHPAVQAVLQEPMANRFVSWWADSPFAEVHCTRAAYYVVLSDLRLRSPWLRVQASISSGRSSMILRVEHTIRRGIAGKLLGTGNQLQKVTVYCAWIRIWRLNVASGVGRS